VEKGRPEAEEEDREEAHRHPKPLPDPAPNLRKLPAHQTIPLFQLILDQYSPPIRVHLLNQVIRKVSVHLQVEPGHVLPEQGFKVVQTQPIYLKPNRFDLAQIFVQCR
jgi:hypothetical protein